MGTGNYMFNRAASKLEGRMRPGEWRPLIGSDGLSAMICCPECQKEATLTKHTIEANGEVRPSVVCPFGQVECPHCSFHVHATLVGWPEELSNQPSS